MLRSKSQKFRLLFQIVFFLIAAYLFYELIRDVLQSAHAYCPYAVVCFGVLKASLAGNMVFLYPIAIVLGLVIGIATMFIGRKFCGYVCPIGTLQEWLFKLRNKKYRLSKRIPFFYERKFRSIKYFVLLLTVFLVLLRKSPLYMNFCPVLVLSRLPYIILPGLIIWLFIIIGGLFTERIFCRFLCPYGALLNLFQYMSKLFGFKRLLIRRNLEKCTDCCLCNKNCPMNINLAEDEYIKDHNCIHCLKCAEVCPKDHTLTEENTSRNCYE